MYSKKKTQKYEKQFQRDNDLGFPSHKTDIETPQRAAFLQNLYNAPDFIKTVEKNDKKSTLSFKQTMKQFGAFEYVVISMFMAGCGILGYSHAYAEESLNGSKQINKTDPKLIGFATFAALVGFVLGTIISSLIIQESRDSRIDNFYNRLTVRLFDAMREEFPDLDESILKECNPEMARVVKTLMITNMPERDTKKIQDIAIEFSKQLQELNFNNKSMVFNACNSDIKNAINIIEQNLLSNHQLYEAILSVYRGKIPTIFALSQQEKTK